MIDTIAPATLLAVIKTFATDKVVPTEVRDGDAKTCHNSIWEWRNVSTVPFEGTVRLALSSEFDQTSVVTTKDKRGRVTEEVRWFRPEGATLLHSCGAQQTLIRFSFPPYDAIGYDFNNPTPLPDGLVKLLTRLDLSKAIVAR